MFRRGQFSHIKQMSLLNKMESEKDDKMRDGGTWNLFFSNYFCLEMTNLKILET